MFRNITLFLSLLVNRRNLLFGCTRNFKTINTVYFIYFVTIHFISIRTGYLLIRKSAYPELSCVENHKDNVLSGTQTSQISFGLVL